eukprot:scaffold1974_cov395-Prasinococcus_capsulatus_cf.AAC.7
MGGYFVSSTRPCGMRHSVTAARAPTRGRPTYPVHWDDVVEATVVRPRTELHVARERIKRKLRGPVPGKLADGLDNTCEPIRRQLRVGAPSPTTRRPCMDG